MDKNLISSHILNIVKNEKIAEQAELQELLKKRGYDIPQATMSRWLKKLHIAKVGGIYKIIDVSAPMLPVVLDVQISDTGLIVLHTHPGGANSIAYFIDQKFVKAERDDSNESGIIGTIAGDDTILVIAKSKDLVPHILATLREFLLFPSLEP